VRHGTADIRGRGRRRDAYDEVASRHTARIQIARPVLRPVLGTLLRARERRRPARDDALHHLGVRAEGGRALARIQHTEAPGRAGADVEEPSAFAKSRGRDVDRARDRVALCGYRRRNQRIFGGHQIDDLGGTRQIDIRRAGVPTLRETQIGGVRRAARLSRHRRVG
jgi:hypothetical protein